MQFSQSKIPFWVVDFEPVIKALNALKPSGISLWEGLDKEQLCKEVFTSLKTHQSNQACLDLFGVADHSQFTQWFECQLKDDLSSFFMTLLQALEEGLDFVESEVQLHQWDNSPLYTIISLSLAQENFSCLYFSAYDLTQHRLSEQKLQQTLLRYELVVEGAFGAIWDWDVVAKRVHFSHSWCAMRNGSRADFSDCQSEWVNSIFEDDREKVLKAVEEHFAGKTQVFEQEYRILCKDGTVKWVADRGVAKRDEQGNVIRMAGSEFDITEKRRSEEKLRLAASVFKNASDGIFILDLEAKITSINRAFMAISGYANDEVLGQDIVSFFPDSAEKNHETVSQCPIGDEKLFSEIELKHQSGRMLPCRLSLNKVFDEEQELTHYVCLITDISQMKKDKKKLYALAHHDHLTQLPNRLLLKQQLDEFIARARRSDKQVAVVFIDLDHFKVINDAMGHTAGDELLIQVASCLKNAVRQEDVVARLGGDEFIVGIENVENTLQISHFVEHLQQQLNSITVLRNRQVRVSASFGIAMFPFDGDDVLKLIRNADTAMYRAKANGRHSFEFYTQDLTEHAIHRMALETDLSFGISNNQLYLEYQPQVRITDGKILGLEALVRWMHPVLGKLAPDRFISLAEETGQIESLGEWVLLQACSQAQSWREQGLFSGCMSVNVSGRQLQKGTLPAMVSKVLEQTGFSANYLELELTESSVMDKTEFAIDQLQALKTLGVSLAIDDFGTGYSSLSYLKKLPIHRLKIDKSFISDIPNNTQDMAISEAIIVMTEKLGLSVIAEGVEQVAQAEFLLNHGCEQAQGYWYSRPCIAASLSPLLRKGCIQPD